MLNTLLFRLGLSFGYILLWFEWRRESTFPNPNPKPKLNSDRTGATWTRHFATTPPVSPTGAAGFSFNTAVVQLGKRSESRVYLVGYTFTG